MTLEQARHPATASWIAALHESEDDLEPLGTAVVLDKRRLLTCAHVVATRRGSEGSLWVAFPKAHEATDERRRVASFEVSKPVYDLALLHLEDEVPAGVDPAPLRYPKQDDLVGQAWWAFGFADRSPLGNSADGMIGSALGYGFVRLDAESRYHVLPGFSGGGIWSPDYAAVVGIAGAANERGDGLAITFHQAALCFPDQKLRNLVKWSAEQSGELALTSWGWTLDSDPEAGRHWRPRARGVTVDSERGHRFRGRRAALEEIVTWLDRAEPDSQVLVVTGSPGVGKSAVLGRIVTTADGVLRAVLPTGDDAVVAAEGSVACAVHAKGKTALDVATEIARAASARLPERIEDLAPAVRNALLEFEGRRFNVVVDALDEAIDAVQARMIVQGVVLPLVETCADVGAQAVVGSRRRDDQGNLLRAFGDGLTLIDLDSPRYFALEDLEAYALATLQLRGGERADNPYADDVLAAPVATRIAALSDRNFLVAGLTALSHGLRDKIAVAPKELSFSSKVEDALNAYLGRVNSVAGVPAAIILTVLAFAQSPGLPIDLWTEGLKALTGIRLSENQLLEFARSSAANFLVEESSESSIRAFRLFHQALNDTLLKERSDKVPAVSDERSLTRAFLSYGKRLGWHSAPTYLLRSLARHAMGGRILDEVLIDDDYLLYADLDRLIPLVDEAASALGQERARLLRLTPYAIGATPDNRVALFSVTEALENLTPTYRTIEKAAPYRARWAATATRAERTVLEGQTAAVSAVCAFTLDGRTRVAAAGEDSTIVIWDPVTAKQFRRLEGHVGSVLTVCELRSGDRTLLASGGDDCTIRLWNPATGQVRVVEEPGSPIRGLCALRMADGTAMLASTETSGMVSLWDTVTGRRVRRLSGHSGNVPAVCSFIAEEVTLLGTAGEDATIRIWNPATGSQERILEGHIGPVWALCAFHGPDGRTMLASTGNDGTVKLWDPATGVQHLSLQGHTGWIWSICAFTSGGSPMLATACADAAVRIWDIETGMQQQVLQGHSGDVWGVCSFYSGERAFLASAGADKTVRVWDPLARQHQPDSAHTGIIRSICKFETQGSQLIATGGDDGTLQAWDPVIGQQQWARISHDGPVYGLCAIPGETNTRLATAGTDGTIRIGNPISGEGELEISLSVQNTWIWSLSYLEMASCTLLIAARDDSALLLYDLARHVSYRLPMTRDAAVKVVCAFYHQDRPLLAAADDNGGVSIWDGAKIARSMGYAPSGVRRRPRRGQEGMEYYQERTMELEPFTYIYPRDPSDTPRPDRNNYSRDGSGHQGQVLAISPIRSGGQIFLATAGADRTVRIWDLAINRRNLGRSTYRQRWSLEGHISAVRAMCQYREGDHSLLVTAGDDWTARIWDLPTRSTLQIIRLHHPALAVTQVEGSIIFGLSAGLLAIQPDLTHQTAQ